MFCGSSFGEPGEKESRDVGDFVLQELHRVVIGIVQDSEALASCIGQGDMAGSVRQPETKFLGHVKSFVKL